MGTVTKALEMLTLFTRTRPQAGLSELARLGSVNKATAHRLLSELAAQGFVEQAGPAREYRLGPAVLGLAALREAHVPTREAALPVLQRLAEATGETAHLSHRVGDELRTLGFAYAAQHGVRVMMEDADLLPWHGTASGQVVLAHLPDRDCDAILSRPMAQVTPRTVTDPATLRATFAAIRAAGLAQAQGTFETDVVGMAAPLFGPGGACVGAVAVAAPLQRAGDAVRTTIATHLRRAAQDITQLWGGPAAGKDHLS